MNIPYAVVADVAGQQSDKIARSWSAAIELELLKGPGRTDIRHVLHKGPLRIQRPFYPEGECCHVYLLHPPGGMVPGDELQVAIDLGTGAEALLTTPSAGKAYKSDKQKTAQLQGITAHISSDACLEWLPQETIIFDGAEAELRNDFHLSGNAKLLAWDIVVLGRRASGESFDAGRCLQRFTILRDGRPLLNERTLWEGGSDMLRANWGMANRWVSGSLFATLEADRATLDVLREGLAAQPYFDKCQAEWGLSQRRDVFMARYLGNSPEHCRKGFEYLWGQLRPLLNGREACRPRIWNT
ncbi:urease accessory protein UreH [Spongiibacter sp. IMCC21906]|uniref:urease accessory protein UreD n=1 Tax=Spongiibacter sp. IMCC21906 TaxID=1620392 RepID=UPI00062DFC36|nr:urease accessory protein UreD [Spongiibacter sp. IMCC21906]AKH67890.1 urease accessory protein UreH [Spongiibacter sp. IMCC21906]